MIDSTGTTIKFSTRGGTTAISPADYAALVTAAIRAALGPRYAVVNRTPEPDDIALIEVYERVGTSSSPDAVVRIEASGLLQVADHHYHLTDVMSEVAAGIRVFRSDAHPMVGRVSLDIPDERAVGMIRTAGAVGTTGGPMDPWAEIVYDGFTFGWVELGDTASRPGPTSGEIG